MQELMHFHGMFSPIPYLIFQIELCALVIPPSNWLCIILGIKTPISYHIVLHKFHSLALRIYSSHVVESWIFE